MESFGANTKIRLWTAGKIFWVVLTAAAGGFIWVGSIQAKVETIEKESSTLSEKVDKVIEDTAYIRGKVDQIGKRK